MYLAPASACATGSLVLVAPTVAQVESRNWNRPYAVDVGFCALGSHEDSLLIIHFASSHCWPVKPWRAKTSSTDFTRSPEIPDRSTSPPPNRPLSGFISCSLDLAQSLTPLTVLFAMSIAMPPQTPAFPICFLALSLVANKALVPNANVRLNLAAARSKKPPPPLPSLPPSKTPPPKGMVGGVDIAQWTWLEWSPAPA